MMNPILEAYANLLTNYCVSLLPGDRVLIRSTTLATDLVREVYKAALDCGAIPEIMLEVEDQEELLLSKGNPEQLEYVSTQYAQAMQNFQGYILIKAPFNLRSASYAGADSKSIRQAALYPHQQNYFKRTASYDLKRTFCMYPTVASAQEAEMNLEDYSRFVYNACHLFDADPIAAWLGLKERQQSITDYLNNCSQIRYLSSDMDISFSTRGRTWINSHGTTNMPSGEVYTSPVEDGVNGFIYFHYPLLYGGKELKGIRLEVKDGLITSWTAESGQETLNTIMKIEGANRFGEAAIGTNTRINRFTRNILFDEKIGGTIHMAIGQSYLQAGGKNQSPVHLDMIADMTKDGQIFADGKLIYEKGIFII
jgi:aminopeptidase